MAAGGGSTSARSVAKKGKYQLETSNEDCMVSAKGMHSTVEGARSADTCPNCGHGKNSAVDGAAVAASQPWAKARSRGCQAQGAVCFRDKRS